MKKMVVLYFCYEDLASSIIHYKFLCKNNFLQSKLLIKMFIFYSMYFFFPISFLRLIYFLIFQNSKNKFVHGVLYVVKYSLPFMQRYPSPQLISVKNSSKHLSNVSFPEYEYQRFVIPFSSVPLPIRDISLCFFFTHSLISFSDNRRRELNLPFLGHTHKCLDPIPWK